MLGCYDSLNPMNRYLPLSLGAFFALTLLSSAEDNPATHPVLPDHQGPQKEKLKGAIRAGTLMGMKVKNPLDETLGQVADIVLDVESGRIVSIIVATNGLIGTGIELSAVPPTALRLNPDGVTLQIEASKALLRNAPHFKPGEWPDFTHTGFVGGIYRAYQRQPFFTTDADNSASNSHPLTPSDQHASKVGVATTAQLRREITQGPTDQTAGQQLQQNPSPHQPLKVLNHHAP